MVKNPISKYSLSMEQVSRVRLAQIDYLRVRSRLCHATCGQLLDDTIDGFERCNFCCYPCKGDMVRSFNLELTLADESGQLCAWCTGQTAIELLQISPDEYYELPEVKRISFYFILYILYTNEPGTPIQLSMYIFWESG